MILHNVANKSKYLIYAHSVNGIVPLTFAQQKCSAKNIMHTHSFFNPILVYIFFVLQKEKKIFQNSFHCSNKRASKRHRSLSLCAIDNNQYRYVCWLKINSGLWVENDGRKKIEAAIRNISIRGWIFLPFVRSVFGHALRSYFNRETEKQYANQAKTARKNNMQERTLKQFLFDITLYSNGNNSKRKKTYTHNTNCLNVFIFPLQFVFVFFVPPPRRIFSARSSHTRGIFFTFVSYARARSEWIKNSLGIYTYCVC